MKNYAMILQNRVIDVLKDRETEPYYHLAHRAIL